MATANPALQLLRDQCWYGDPQHAFDGEEKQTGESEFSQRVTDRRKTRCSKVKRFHGVLLFGCKKVEAPAVAAGAEVSGCLDFGSRRQTASQ